MISGAESRLGNIEINNGGQWQILPCYDVPASLENGAALQVLCDWCFPGYEAASMASLARTATQLRLNAADTPRLFWVELSNTPTLAAGRMMTSLMILTPAAV